MVVRLGGKNSWRRRLATCSDGNGSSHSRSCEARAHCKTSQQLDVNGFLGQNDLPTSGMAAAPIPSIATVTTTSLRPYMLREKSVEELLVIEMKRCWGECMLWRYVR